MRLKTITSATLILLAISLATLAITPYSTANTGTIQWSGYTWNIKNSGTLQWTPGPCYWSANNVWVDQNGWLHLQITNVNGQWKCAEIASTQTFGYGTYTFYTVSRIDNFDPNVVLGMFAYQDNNHECDLEYTKWSVANNNGWFTVQPPPVYEGTTYQGFNFEMSGDYATSYIKWAPNLIHFETDGGHYKPGTAPTGNIISSFTSNKQINLNGAYADINLWLFRGVPPSDGQTAEVVISRFTFTPM